MSKRRRASTTHDRAVKRRATTKRRVPTGLSRKGTAARKLQDTLLQMYNDAIEADPAAVTNNRFQYYELVTMRVIEKDSRGSKKNSNAVIAALTPARPGRSSRAPDITSENTLVTPAASSAAFC